MDRYGAFVFVQSLHCAILDSFDIFFAGERPCFLHGILIAASMMAFEMILDACQS